MPEREETLGLKLSILFNLTHNWSIGSLCVVSSMFQLTWVWEGSGLMRVKEI